MDHLAPIAVGLLLIVLGYLIAYRQKIGLIHPYHYKRVAEADKAAFCKGEGIGNIITGIGVIAMGADAYQLGVILLLGGIVLSLAVIIKYNHGLF